MQGKRSSIKQQDPDFTTLRASIKQMSNSSAEEPLRQFASDTYAGICPEAFAALQNANHGHAPAYGDDRWTARATTLFRELFEVDCDVFFVPTGTAANAL